MRKFYAILTNIAIFAMVYTIGCYAWMGAEWYFLKEVTFNRVDCGVACMLAAIISKEIIMIYHIMCKQKRGGRY